MVHLIVQLTQMHEEVTHTGLTHRIKLTQRIWCEEVGYARDSPKGYGAKRLRTRTTTGRRRNVDAGATEISGDIRKSTPSTRPAWRGRGNWMSRRIET
jgi:hypothetical protein